jgi:NAD(P)-dependent dehydrogenase (short-subunit alcohol dehydrogenase family)
VYFRQARHPGAIVNTASTSGLGNPGQTNYAAAKEGIVGMTRTVAREMGRYGVRCNAIRPQAATRMTLSDEMKQRFARAGEAGMKMLAELEKQVPEEIGPFVAWLCTDEAANINGRTFLVRAGYIGLYSEPEVIAAVETDKPWTVDLVSQLVRKPVTANLVNEWPLQPPKE